MDIHSGQQIIKQLEKQKGGYFYLSLDAAVVDQFEKKKATRLICTLDHEVSYRCGLNHLGDGNFYIIVASKYLKQIGKQAGDSVSFKIVEDPDPLGVEMPEVLKVFLEQDAGSKQIFNTLTDGKKRSLIYSMLKIKDIDKQVQLITAFLTKEQFKVK